MDGGRNGKRGKMRKKGKLRGREGGRAEYVYEWVKFSENERVIRRKRKEKEMRERRKTEDMWGRERKWWLEEEMAERRRGGGQNEMGRKRKICTRIKFFIKVRMK